jgi:hypothetical protein
MPTCRCHESRKVAEKTWVPCHGNAGNVTPPPRGTFGMPTAHDGPEARTPVGRSAAARAARRRRRWAAQMERSPRWAHAAAVESSRGGLPSGRPKRGGAPAWRHLGPSRPFNQHCRAQIIQKISPASVYFPPLCQSMDEKRAAVRRRCQAPATERMAANRNDGGH